MKKLLLSLVLFGISFSMASSQQEAELDFSVKEKILSISPLPQKINEEIAFLDPFKICQDIFAWDTIASQFVYAGEGLISYEEMGDVKKLTLDFTALEDGELTYFKVENYFSFQQFSTNEMAGDSSLIYFGDGMGNYTLIAKNVNFFEEEVLIKTEDYFDFSFFGLPLGFMKSGETFYEYDSNGFLIKESSFDFDFSTFTFALSDSTIHVNNNLGLPIESTSYTSDFLTGEFGPSTRSNFRYVNDYFVSEEVMSQFESEMWVTYARNTLEYDNQDRLVENLSEVTMDNGANWLADSKSQSVYENDLPFNFPSTQLEQNFQGGEWVNSSLTTSEDCTTGVELIPEIDFECWISNQQLVLNVESLQNDQLISLYDLQGRKILESRISSYEKRIDVSNLAEGIYIVELVSEQGRTSRKVFK